MHVVYESGWGRVALALAGAGGPQQPHRCRRQQERRAARMAARAAVARLVGASRSRHIAIRGMPGRPPVPVTRDLNGGEHTLSVSLSLSHRDGRGAAVAAALPIRVGVDLERDSPIPAGHERFFLSATERRLVPRRGTAELWALKEAAWKALPCGADLPFSELELRFSGAGCVGGAVVAGSLYPARAAVLRPWPGHVLAVLVALRDPL